MAAEIENKSWFSKNWMWVLPVGGCLTVILLFVFGIGTAIFGISKILSNSTPYEYALETAKNSPEVQAVLGSPIETAGIMNGSISIDDNGGDADFKIPIKGSKSKGSIVVKATKIDGEWQYENLYVQIKKSKEKINLIDKSLEGI